MTTQSVPPLIDFFKDSKDPRIERNKAYPLSLFQNPVGFGQALGKTGQKPDFSAKSKEAVPKSEVLEQPPLYRSHCHHPVMYRAMSGPYPIWWTQR
jgi:hypothetical protein